jgi:hypothetical protein
MFLRPVEDSKISKPGPCPCVKSVTIVMYLDVCLTYRRILDR